MARLLTVSVTVVTAVTAMMAGGPRSGSAPLRAADFAALLANHASAGPRLGPDQAAERLRLLGVPIGDPDAPLTEGRLSEIMEFYGVRAGTGNPDSTVSAELGSAVASILNSTVLFVPGTEKGGNGKGKGNNDDNDKNKPEPPPDLDLGVCLSERNRGHCVNCCKDLGSPANACAHFCKSIDPPSPSNPR
jgi:hypothetical protein